jgi:hypothetical protein
MKRFSGFALIQVLIYLMGISFITLIGALFLTSFFYSVQEAASTSLARLSFFMAHDACVTLLRKEVRQDPLAEITSNSLSWQSPKGSCFLWHDGTRLLLKRGKQVRTLASGITHFQASRQHLSSHVDLITVLLTTQIGQQQIARERSVRIEKKRDNHV